MKQRITSLDIKTIVFELRSLIVGYRLQNIYNILNSDRIFNLKFSKPDSKKSLIIDYGFKLYLSGFERRLEPTPSSFVTKLRKHLKSKRLTGLKQVGNDRIIVLEFSNGHHYLVLEFFSAGNIILLNSELDILSLQRLVTEKENNDKYAVREKYSMFNPKELFADSIKYFQDEEKEEVDESIELAEKKIIENLKFEITNHTKEELLSWLKIGEEKQNNNKDNVISKFHQTNKNKKKQNLTVQKLLFSNCAYLSSDLIQKNLTNAAINGNTDASLLKDEDFLESVVEVLNKTEKEVSNIFNHNVIKGYIVLKRNPLYNPDEEPISSLLGDGEKLTTEYTFEQFHPFEPIIETNDLESGKFKLIEINGYNKTLDKFFSSIDVLKNSLKIQQNKNLLNKKLNSVKRENDAKIEKLVSLEATNYRKAELIILNADKIEECKAAVQSSIDQGMDWKHIESLIEAAQMGGNEFAKMIVLPLDLKNNKIKVKLLEDDLSEKEDEKSEDEIEDTLSDLSLSDDEEENDNKPVKKPTKDLKFVVVDIDLGISAYANSKTYFDQKKTAQSKKERTEKTAELALKNSEKKINATLKKDLEKSDKALSIKKSRQKNWFEKFYWFISSENYLIIAPKDNLQFEMIYYKYFNSQHDYYVSSDIEDSLKVFIKNPFIDQAIPPSTLNQAGMFALSASKAWNSKILTSAWYVEGNKLSKKDPHNGTLLSDGNVFINGEKSFLPPSQLSMGVAFIWILSEEDGKINREKRLKRQEELGFEVVKEIANVKDVQREKVDKLKNEEVEEIKKIEKVEKTEKVNEEEVIEQPKPTNNTPTPPKKLTRGKKNKLKKLNEKYADQDDEERIMKLKALGVFKQVEERDKQLTKQKQEESLTSSQQKEKLHEAHKKQLLNQERQQKKYSEQFMDILNETLVDSDYLSILDNYAYKINSLNDKVIDIIPMFAPWQSLTKFKYKAKIQAGSAKTGKSMNEILNYFTNRKMNKEMAIQKKFENSDQTKNIDSMFDFDLDFEFEHKIINQLKPIDLQPSFTAKGLRVLLPSSNKKNGSGNGKSAKGKKK